MADAIRQGVNEQACLDEEEEYALMSAEVQDFHDQCNGDESAWDDVNNVPLNPKAVKQARKEEITYVRKMRIYDRIKRSSIIAAGHSIIKVRWIDTNKGDDIHPNMRSRLVAKDFKFADKNRLDLFAATPPLELLKAQRATRTTIKMTRSASSMLTLGEHTSMQRSKRRRTWNHQTKTNSKAKTSVVN